MPGFESPFSTIRRKKITHARPAAGDCFEKDFLHDSEQLFDLGNGKTVRPNVRMQTCTEQNLVRIDVPDPGDSLLMHHECFQSPGTGLHHRKERVGGDGQGIAPESPSHVAFEPRLVEQGHSPEPAWIPITEFRLSASGEGEPNMDMLREPGLHGRKKQQARHSKFRHHVPDLFVAFEPQDDALAESFDTG
jgi:hypothetical protein